MRSEAETVGEYLDDLPDDRRDAVETVRATILDRLPAGYEEVMNWGMITYQVPLDLFPETYNQQPLMYAALASQKNHMAVYLSGIYSDDDARKRFEDAYRATGKRLDIGKSCVRFKKLDDLPLEVIGDAVAAYAVDEFVKTYEEGRAKARSRSKGR